MITQTKLLSVLIATASLLLAPAALAQADPAVEAARARGEVGEQADGYLGLRSGGGDLKARAA